jgi:hypothetical protein
VADDAAPGVRTVVYKYAVVGDGLPECVIAEMRRAHDLRNRLVEIEQAHAERVAAVWAEHPEIAAAAERLAKADAALEEAGKAAAAERRRTGSKRVSGLVAAALTAARAERKEAKYALRRLKELRYPLLKPALQEAGEERRKAIKATYGPARDAGLYWATYNAVVQNHETAVRRVASAHAGGRPAQLRFHGWDGTGRIAVQLQRRPGHGPRSPQVLASGAGRWRNVVQVGPWTDPESFDRERARRFVVTDHQGRRVRGGGRRHRLDGGWVTIRLGAGDHGQTVTLPITVHRPMPPEADVVQVLITRQRFGPFYRAHVNVVCNIPAPKPRTEGRLAALHLGWRRLGDGGIRVAVALGIPSTPLRGPAAHWVHHHDTWAEIVVPPDYQRRMERADKIRSRRDQNTETLKTWLADHLEAHPWLTEKLGHEAATVRQWRSGKHLAGLARHLSTTPPPPTDTHADAELWRDITEQLTAWRKQDLHLWRWEAGARRRAIEHRKDAYRNIAAWLIGDDAAVISMDNWNIQTLSKTPPIGADENDGQAANARAARATASPGILRDAVKNAATARGAHVITPKLTAPNTHHGCGGTLNADARRANIMAPCDTCGRMVDQDLSAARHLLNAARHP